MHKRRSREAIVSIPGMHLGSSLLQARAATRINRRWPLPRSQSRRLAEELLFVPYFIFRFLNPAHRKRFYRYDVLVDGILGMCEFLRGSFELREQPVPRDTLLEIAITADEAEARAREAVKSQVLRRQPLWVREIKVELQETRRIYYPYWVCYVETRRGPDLLALNGITGVRAGPRAEAILRVGIAGAEREQAGS
jgi:hypothetical protein